MANSDGYVKPRINEYSADSTLMRTILPKKNVVAAALLTGPSGELYVADFNSSTGEGNDISVYGASGTAPVRTISNGIRTPSALAIDAAGDLYVANSPTRTPAASSVTEYASGGSTPRRAISTGINYPVAIALGTKGP